jgi:hypothetical protein
MACDSHATELTNDYLEWDTKRYPFSQIQGSKRHFSLFILVSNA